MSNDKAINSITDQESIAISFIRVLAMFLIITCHFLQAYGYSIAFLFNVGVQLFFFTSGFLYGKIEISNPWRFYKRRLLKIYLPYISFVSAILILQMILGLWKFSIRDVIIYLLNFQGFISTTVQGIHHLWFLSVLMICYVLAPILQRLINSKLWPFVLLIIVISIVEFAFVQKMYSTYAWVLLFLVGMIYGKYEQPHISLMAIIGSALLLLGLFSCFCLDTLLNQIWAHYSVWLHFVLAICIFATSYYFIPKFCPPSINLKILKHIDSISYEVYLVHHPLILGPLSLLTLTPFVGLNIIMILLLTYAIAYVCAYMFRKIRI